MSLPLAILAAFLLSSPSEEPPRLSIDPVVEFCLENPSGAIFYPVGEGTYFEVPCPIYLDPKELDLQVQRRKEEVPEEGHLAYSRAPLASG